jgi:hypothetical protein
MAHELGHYLHHWLNGHVGWKSVADDFKSFTVGELPVSGYEPNTAESIAEAVRLFVLSDIVRYLSMTRCVTMNRLENGAVGEA